MSTHGIGTNRPIESHNRRYGLKKKFLHLVPRRRLARRLPPGEAHRRLEACQACQAVVQMAVGQGDERLILLLKVGDRPVHLVEKRSLLFLHPAATAAANGESSPFRTSP